MASGMDWFRWHHGSVSDPKFQLVAKRAGASVAEVVALWASLLEAASAADQRGSIGLPDFEALDCALGLEEGRAARIFAAMEARGLVDGAERRIVAWDRRQPKRERADDDSAARVRQHREKKRQLEPCNASGDHGTPCNATERQETPRGEESRGEETPPVAPSAAADGAAPPPPEPEPPSTGKGRRRAEQLTLPAWLTLVRAKGEKAVPLGDPVYAYAEGIGLPEEMLVLAWQAFKRRYAKTTKRYRDWRAVFRRAVEENWLRLWYLQDGAYALTTQGHQVQRALEAERAGAAA